MRHSPERRAVSEIVGILLMLAIVVSLGVAFYGFASGGMASLSQGFSSAHTIDANALLERFRVEQVAFSTGSVATPALDGTNYATQGTPTATIAASLTTTSTNDVIIVIVFGQNTATGTYQTPSVSDSVALSWHARTSLQEVSVAGGYSLFSEIFYAIAPSALSGDTITVTWDSAPTHYAVLQVFGVSGANTASPFDAEAGPGEFATGAYASVASSNANDFIYGMELTAVTGSPTAGSGFTGIESGVGGTFASEYKVVSAIQSALGMTYSNAGSDTDGAWGDAIEGAAVPITGANVYVRNVGTIPSTLVSAYVTDQTSGTFVSQTTMSDMANVGTFVEISLSFTGTHGHMYSFTVTSSLGNSVTYEEEAT